MIIDSTRSWFGLVWFGLVWFGLVWFGLVWFGLVWFVVVWLFVGCFDLFLIWVKILVKRMVKPWLSYFFGLFLPILVQHPFVGLHTTIVTLVQPFLADETPQFSPSTTIGQSATLVPPTGNGPFSSLLGFWGP